MRDVANAGRVGETDTHYPPASISAQLRHLRKPEYGGFVVEKQPQVVGALLRGEDFRDGVGVPDQTRDSQEVSGCALAKRWKTTFAATGGLLNRDGIGAEAR
jgi:hypothetical protein